MSSIVAICSTAQPGWAPGLARKTILICRVFECRLSLVSPLWTMVASHSHTCSSHISPCYISLIDHYSQPYNGPSLCKYNENVSDKVLSRTPRGEAGEERMQFTASLRDLFDRNYKIIKCTSPLLLSSPLLLFPSCIILTYPGFNRIQSGNETSTSSLF